MKLLKRAFRHFGLVLLCCFSQSVAAENILPASMGKLTAALVAEKNAPHLPVGTVVEFIGTNQAGIPKPLGVHGSVLGTRDAVVFSSSPAEMRSSWRRLATSVWSNIRCTKKLIRNS